MKCDKSSVKCDISITQCDDKTINCEKKKIYGKLGYLGVAKLDMSRELNTTQHEISKLWVEA